MKIQANPYGTGTIRLWKPPIQPDIWGEEDSFANIEWTSDEIDRYLYEPLKELYHYHIQKIQIGQDTSGTCAMYAWELTPPHYEKTVYLQSGVHAIETEGYFGLARLIRLICEGTDERLKAVRDHVRFLIGPMVSVWGITHKGNYQQIMSLERYEKCPHNVLGINPNRDFWDCRLQETLNVKQYFAAHASEIDFMFDLHTTTMPEWGAYLLPYPDRLDTKYITKLVQINSMLYLENCDFQTPIAYMGDDSRYPTAPITSGFAAGFHHLYQIPGSTLEHSDYVFDSILGSSVCMTRAVELYGNHLLAFLEY